MLGLKHPKTFRANYLRPLLEAGWLKMTVPDKPTSRKQRYGLTERGQEALAALDSGTAGTGRPARAQVQ